MGNCVSEEPKSAKEKPTLQELKYLDSQQGINGTRNGPHHPPAGSVGSFHPRHDPMRGPPPHGAASSGYVQPGMYPAYGGYPVMGHPRDHAGMYYQPRGPMLVMDPYGNAYTYDAYDGDGYDYGFDGDRRHHRRKKDRHRSKSARDNHDDDDDDGGDDDDRDDDRKHDRKRTSKKTPQQNGGPPTANSVAVSSAASAAPAGVVRSAAASSASSPRRRKPDNYVPPDVMISYSRKDHFVMTKVKEALEGAGLTVWVDLSNIGAGADFLGMIGEAIIDAKLFVCLLSEQSMKSKHCRDEVALAYVSNTAIFPANLVPKDQLVATMDTGLKLQLASYKWMSLEDPNKMDANIRVLVGNMKAEMDKLRGEKGRAGVSSAGQPATATTAAANGAVSANNVVVSVGGGEDAGASPPHSPLSDTDDLDLKPSSRLREVNRAASEDQDDAVSHVMPEQFWSDHFGTFDFVDWGSFSSAFLEKFRDPVQQTFSAEETRQLTEILRREMEVDDDNRLYKHQFMTFFRHQGVATPVWQRVQDQARESFAMREVFSMDSSVRVEAIENLGKYRSAAVIDALRDLLTDPDANVRAVATVSLARTDANDPATIRHIMRMLADKDRLVREAGCLALGRLRARQAVSKLTHIWRNDVISHVREAAAAALNQIGGQEVENVMRVTKVLAEEIRTLTDME